MDAIQVYTTVEKDGEIHVSNLPFKRGQQVELIVRAEPTPHSDALPLTAQRLLASELIGLWEARPDIDSDSPEYARQLREQAQPIKNTARSFPV